MRPQRQQQQQQQHNKKTKTNGGKDYGVMGQLKKFPKI